MHNNVFYVSFCNSRDDEDALLYGEIMGHNEEPAAELRIPAEKTRWDKYLSIYNVVMAILKRQIYSVKYKFSYFRAKIEVKVEKPTYWLFLVRENGVLEVCIFFFFLIFGF